MAGFAGTLCPRVMARCYGNVTFVLPALGLPLQRRFTRFAGGMPPPVSEQLGLCSWPGENFRDINNQFHCTLNNLFFGLTGTFNSNFKFTGDFRR